MLLYMYCSFVVFITGGCKRKRGEYMHLQESGEMYLETIYVLSRSKGTVRSLDVASI